MSDRSLEVDTFLRELRPAPAIADAMLPRDGRWMPSLHLTHALDVLGAAEGRPLDLPGHLGEVAVSLLDAAGELWWPLHMRHELEISPEEMPWELINASPLGAIGDESEQLTAEDLAQAIAKLLSRVSELEERGAELVPYHEIEDAADRATELAVRAATLAVRYADSRSHNVEGLPVRHNKS